MIDIFAKYIDGQFVFTPKKRRGMSKGEYLRALAACERLNNDGIQHSSSAADFVSKKTPDAQLSLFDDLEPNKEKTNKKSPTT
jgi:hypothetical protein